MPCGEQKGTIEPRDMRELNVLQWAIILIWVIALAVLAAFPPWTTHNVGTRRGSPSVTDVDIVSPVPKWNAIQLRWFLASPEWRTVNDSNYEKDSNGWPTRKAAYEIVFVNSTGRVRYDLLAQELLMVSVMAVGLLFAASRLRNTKGGEQ